MLTISPLPAVQAAACPMLNTCDSPEQHIAHEVLLLAIMKELAALPNGEQRLVNIEQFCISTLEGNVQREPLRVVSALISAAKQSE